MRIAVGDQIRADCGGGMFVSGVVDSVAFGKIRVKLPNGHVMETSLRGEHTVNGRRPPDPVGYAKKLTELDSTTNLSEWEKEFVGDLMERSTKHLSPKQEEMIDRIYNRRVNQ